jgi:hypothetical protein
VVAAAVVDSLTAVLAAQVAVVAPVTLQAPRLFIGLAVPALEAKATRAAVAQTLKVMPSETAAVVAAQQVAALTLLETLVVAVPAVLALATQSRQAQRSTTAVAVAAGP